MELLELVATLFIGSVIISITRGLCAVLLYKEPKQMTGREALNRFRSKD